MTGPGLILPGHIEAERKANDEVTQDQLADALSKAFLDCVNGRKIKHQTILDGTCNAATAIVSSFAYSLPAKARADYIAYFMLNFQRGVQRKGAELAKQVAAKQVQETKP